MYNKNIIDVIDPFPDIFDMDDMDGSFLVILGENFFGVILGNCWSF